MVWLRRGLIVLVGVAGRLLLAIGLAGVTTLVGRVVLVLGVVWVLVRIHLSARRRQRDTLKGGVVC